MKEEEEEEELKKRREDKYQHDNERMKEMRGGMKAFTRTNQKELRNITYT